MVKIRPSGFLFIRPSGFGRMGKSHHGWTKWDLVLVQKKPGNTVGNAALAIGQGNLSKQPCTIWKNKQTS